MGSHAFKPPTAQLVRRRGRVIEVHVTKLTGDFRLVNESDAALYIQESQDYLRNARHGRAKVAGPRVVQIGRSCFYDLSELDRWNSAKKRRQAKATIRPTLSAARVG